MRSWNAIRERGLCDAAAYDMELEVLDPRSHWNYGSLSLNGCINDIENHNSNASAYRFDAGGKGAYDRWWAMVDVIGRWMRAGGLGGWKMEVEQNRYLSQ